MHQNEIGMERKEKKGGGEGSGGGVIIRVNDEMGQED